MTEASGVKMYKKSLLSVLVSLVLMAFAVSSCTSEGGGSIIPDEPAEVQDTISLKIMSSIDVEAVPLGSRGGNSRDLIGVEVIRKVVGSSWNAGVPTSVIYASGVFDDIDDIVFKFVKGGTYRIRMTYYPNAKDIVYNYPDGTFGAPFSWIFGLQSYKLNEPVYYGGFEDGGDGNVGPVLGPVLDDVYQPTSDRNIHTFKRGDTSRYSGQTEEITVDEKTSITVKLELCLMAITLQPDNFTEGMLSLVFRNYMYMERDNATWNVRPGDNMTHVFQIPYDSGEESLELFYTNGNGERFLLATKRFERKYATNFVFKFALAERADGSIGIQMPSGDSLTEEDATFDF